VLGQAPVLARPATLSGDSAAQGTDGQGAGDPAECAQERWCRVLTKMVPADWPMPDPKQAGRHKGTETFRRLVESIRQFGVLQPPGVLPDRRVAWGNGRVLAGPEAGLTEIPVVLLDRPM